MGAGKYAFIKSGAFSHVNVSLRRALEAALPELELVEIDIWRDIIRRNPGWFLLGVAESLLLYRRHVLAQPSSVRFAALRTPRLFRKVGELIGERVRQIGGDCRFTFQTQSFYQCGRSAGLPHFLFSDHTHLANLRYPAFDRSKIYPRLWTDLEREIYEAANHTFVMSEHVRQSVIEDYGISGDRVTTVFGGSNLEGVPAPLENDGYRNRTVVFVGIEWERKGGRTLAAAFEKVVRDLPDARLVVIGCQPGLGQPWCEELGKIPREDVKQHLVRGSVFCMPTLIEPFGIAVLEALAHEIPVVVSDIGAMPTVVRDGVSGLVVPAQNADALAFALKTLLTDPDRCRAMGGAGRKDVEDRYSWPVVGRKIAEVIRRTLLSAE